MIYKLFQDSSFRIEKIDREHRKSHIVRPQFVKQLHMLMQFLYGVTTLRDVRPAVNRQPGYRRVDSQSGYQQTQKNLKTNSNHKTRHDRTTERAKAQTDDVQTERAIDEFNRFAQLEDTQTEPWRTTQENRWTKWANVHQHLAATHYNIHNHKNVDVTQ